MTATRGAGSTAAGDVALDAGNRQTFAVLNAHLVELVGNQLRRLEFAESGFRVGQNLLGDADYFFPVPFDGGAGPFLQLFLSPTFFSAS